MTNVLTVLKDFFYKFDKNDFYLQIAAFFSGLLVVVIGMLYFYYMTVNDLKGQLKRLNIKREEAQQVLLKQKQVQKQQEEINLLLSEEKNFKIKSFIDDLLKECHLEGSVKKEAEVTEQMINKSYTEIQLKIQFKGISMQQFVEFLNKIEQKSRLYTKELIITKATQDTIDVALSIATLKPQQEVQKP